ncbi:MAG: DUF4143 domain-containing protein, partial [Lachnospiraceae bacterium]|nr:DUF4143 domain-containing protein [Lachnospiraceae bacterium]
QNLFKLYLADSGLMHAMYAEDVQAGMLQNQAEKEMGIVMENAFAQILTAKGFKIRYFNEKNKGELNFLIQKGQEVIPMEIRSGENYREHSALTFVLNREDLKLHKGIVYCDRNMEKDGNISYLPWYMVLLMKP